MGDLGEELGQESQNAQSQPEEPEPKPDAGS